MSHRHHRAKYRRSRRGERIFGALVRKRKPIRLDDLSDVERLSLIFGQSQGVAELLEFADGDLLNLIGVDLRDLEAVPGVGPALAAKAYAFLYELGRLVQRVCAEEEDEEEGQDQPQM